MQASSIILPTCTYAAVREIAAVKFRNNLNMFATGLAALLVAAVIVYVVFSVLTNSKSL